MRYFLGIEVAYSRQGIVLSQHKYGLDLLEETAKMLSKLEATPVNNYVKLESREKSAHVSKEAFQRLVRKLIYLNYTRPNIAYVVNLLSQFMNDPKEIHQQTTCQVLAYLKGIMGQGILLSKEGSVSLEMDFDTDFLGSFTDRRSTSGYYALIGGSLVTWCSKKYKVVTLLSADVEYRVMVHGVKEAIWIQGVLE